MKFCPKCGAQLADEAAFCDKCGANLSQNRRRPCPQGGLRLGVAALVLSIIGFLTGFLGFGLVLDVIAIVLAALVLVKAKKQPIKTGTATGGLIVAILSVVLCGGHPGTRPDEGTERPRGERNADGSAERGFPGTGY